MSGEDAINSSSGLVTSEEEAAAAARNEKPGKKPPFRRPGWYEAFFGIIQARKVEVVDTDFVKANIAQDRSDAGKFISGLKFLGLIDDSGRATPKMEMLRLTGDEFTQSLQQIIRESYRDVFEKVALETAKKDNVTNFFITKYDLSGASAAQAVELFVYFAQKAGIKLSEGLGSAQVVSRAPPSVTRERRQVNQSVGKELLPGTIAPDTVDELRMGQVRVWLPKGDAKAARTAKSLIDLYIQNMESPE